MKNPFGKTTKKENPYEVWQAGDWTWLVLKKWQTPEKEKGNPYARWFCAVQSPMTYGDWDLGDTYVGEIKRYAFKLDENAANAFLKSVFGEKAGITKVE